MGRGRGWREKKAVFFEILSGARGIMMHKHAKSNTFSGNYYVTQKQRQRETLLLCANETENTEDEVDFTFFPFTLASWVLAGK